MNGVLDADVVVVGSGLAGLASALELHPLRVHLVTRGALETSGATRWAQGGIAAAVGPAAIERLQAWGVGFDHQASGRLDLAREAAHGRARVVHARDRTGAEIVRALVARLRQACHVRVFEGESAVRLALDRGVVCGVHTRAQDGSARLHTAPCVLLATGGSGHLYRFTTNPPEARGDGLALALHAGATTRDLELVQFHPTALDVGTDPMPLLSEALRGHGAKVVDAAGRRFLVEAHPEAELAPRDVVARALARQRFASGRAFLDLRPLAAELAERFPSAAAACAEAGIDPALDPLPIAPAAHYHMGGIATDLDGRTSLPGLWACGEVAATGVHGANRLASNSLLEAVVFARRAARDIHHRGGRGGDPGPLLAAASDPSSAASRLDDAVTTRLRELMWERVGLLREGDGLRVALSEIDILVARVGPGPVHDCALVCRAIAAAALAVGRSRGAHVRLDDPTRTPDPQPFEGAVAC